MLSNWLAPLQLLLCIPPTYTRSAVGLYRSSADSLPHNNSPHSLHYICWWLQWFVVGGPLTVVTNGKPKVIVILALTDWMLLKKTYLHLTSLFDNGMLYFVKIHSDGRPKYPHCTQSISLLLMTWHLAVPGHQQSWYWPSYPGIFQVQHQTD